MRVGPSKEYGDTSTITLRFRTLGMTLSRGKSPQAGRNNTCPSPPLFSETMLVLVHHRPVRSLVTSFSPRSFLSASRHPLVLSRHHLQRRLIDDHDPSTRLRGRPSPSNLIHFSLPLSSLSSCRPLTYSQIFTPHHHFYLARVDTEPFYRFMACVLYRR